MALLKRASQRTPPHDWYLDDLPTVNLEALDRVLSKDIVRSNELPPVPSQGQHWKFRAGCFWFVSRLCYVLFVYLALLLGFGVIGPNENGYSVGMAMLIQLFGAVVCGVIARRLYNKAKS